MKWPEDADGDVLQRLEENNFDFDKETTIDFIIDFNHWPLTEEEKIEIKKLYPECELYNPDEEDIAEGNLNGHVQFQVVDKLTYELVIKTQETATEQMKKYNGWCDSWSVMQD
jgi:hypothetical protein